MRRPETEVSINRKLTRRVQFLYTDYPRTAIDAHLVGNVSLDEIKQFCTGCEYLEVDQNEMDVSCRAKDKNFQGRMTGLRECRDASVGGQDMIKKAGINNFQRKP